jgi:hypothetical protein
VDLGAIRAQTFELTVDRSQVQHFWDRHPTRVAIDSDGIRIDYGPSKSRVLRWEDPRLQFALLDYREAPHNRPPWVRFPKQFEFRFRPELGVSSFAIPEPVYRALAAAAQSAGLALGPSATGGGIPAGTKILHYARRRLRWWSRVRGNP